MRDTRPKDLTGKAFNYLTVIEYVGSFPNKQGIKERFWRCKCVCGKELVLPRADLTKNRRKSCGCMTHDLISNTFATHRLSKTSLYRRWSHMKERCTNPRCAAYKYYGARGIEICEEWKNSFETFRDWAFSHGYSENLTIERIDVNGNYEPDNCCWIPLKEQALNTRHTHKLTYNGITMTASAWGEYLGGSKNLIFHRLSSGWSVDKALSTPPRKIKRKNNI